MIESNPQVFKRIAWVCSFIFLSILPFLPNITVCTLSLAWRWAWLIKQRDPQEPKRTACVNSFICSSVYLFCFPCQNISVCILSLTLLWGRSIKQRNPQEQKRTTCVYLFICSSIYLFWCPWQNISICTRSLTHKH